MLPSALDAVWNGTACIVPAITFSYDCSSPSLKLANYFPNWFCYLAIPMAATTINDTQRYDYYNNVCYEQTGGGNLACVNHPTVNNYTFNVAENSEYVMIGLVSANGTVSTGYDLLWIDGTRITYLNYAGGSPGETSDFYFTIMDVDKYWWTNMTTVPEKTSLVCRVAATLVLTKR
uniref:C-type lectin domain-containing protein n=1 Tax=Panagrellus redivivus TaxID=6233 RepID=A0A7E4VXB1_PANRE